MPRLLIVPSNNSLSHIAQGLALEDALIQRGHEVCLAVGQRHAAFVERLGRPFKVLPDIQEADDSGFPTPEWFRDPTRIRACVEAERRLLREFRPDRAIGIFRFTLGLSARMEGVPWDSLACASMLPESPEVLGFGPKAPGREAQRTLLAAFYRYAGTRLSRALNVEPVEDVRTLLHGDRTFLWDVAEFAPLPELPGVQRVGPFFWQGWPTTLEALPEGGGPLAVLSFGTCMGSPEAAERVIGALRRLGYRVLLAAGGQVALLRGSADPGVVRTAMVPMRQVLPLAELVVCHGGQMTVFEALSHRRPVLVLPFQPEQAQNGIALERIGCGGLLVPPTHSLFSPGSYLRAMDDLGPGGLERTIQKCTEDPELPAALEGFQAILARQPGLEGLCEHFCERP